MGALLGALVAVGLLTSCTVGPSTRPPVAVRADLPPAPPAPPGAPVPLPVPEAGRASLPLSDCTPSSLGSLDVPVPTDRVLRTDCGTLTVPLDPAQPALGTVTLGVVRAGMADVPGRTPLAARPALLVVGDSATDPTARRAVRMAAQVPTYLLANFAIIGLDRRGAGTDTLDCADPSARSALADADPATADTTLLLERARAVVQACNVALDGQLGGFSSEAAADDIEAVRQALGVARLSALGTGDGAEALADWARAHPRAVGRLVLDGPPDPGLDEPARSEARAQATEAAFDAFAQRCTSRSACPLGADPRTAVTALVTSLRAQPLSTPDGRQLSAGTAVTAIRVALGEPSSWATLTDALQAARAGDPRRSSTGSSRPSARAAATTPRSPPTATTRRTGSRPPRSRSSPGSGRRRTRSSGAASRPTSWRALRGPPGRPGAGARPGRPAAARRDRHGSGPAIVDGRRPGRGAVAALGRVHRLAGRGDRRVPAHAMRELARGQPACGRAATRRQHPLPALGGWCRTGRFGNL